MPVTRTQTIIWKTVYCRSLVSEYRVDLDREIALDWFVLQTELMQNQTFLERFEDCADISRGHWRKTCWSCAVQKGNSKTKVLMTTLSSLLCRWRARRYAYRLKPGLQYTQETGAKPRELKRKSVYKPCGCVYKIFLSVWLRSSSRRPPRSPTTRLP